MPLSHEQIRSRGYRLVEIAQPVLVAEGFMVIGQIPRSTQFDDTGVVGLAFLDAAGLRIRFDR